MRDIDQRKQNRKPKYRPTYKTISWYMPETACGWVGKRMDHPMMLAQWGFQIGGWVGSIPGKLNVKSKSYNF